jgi:hypothetical protein
LILRHLEWPAVFVGFAGGYAAPVLLACVVADAAWLSPLWLLAPVVAGYLAAKLALELPLMHGLAVSALGLAVFGLVSAPHPAAAWIAWIAINAACSIFGAWLWRRYERSPA